VYLAGSSSNNVFKIAPASGGGGGGTVMPIHGRTAWWLLVPALILVWARRREGALRP
jgi:hypothetical protein